MASTVNTATTTNGPVPPVVYSVLVNGAPTPATDLILNVFIDMCWGNHDLVGIRVEYNRGTNMAAVTPWATNSLVTVIWGQSATSLNTWYGYMNHYEMKSNADSGMHNLQITYYCLGTSAPMNAQLSYNWGNVTGTFVAKTMAKKYGFRCVVTSNSTIINNLQQANMSDFQFMNYLAQKTGYRFWCSNGTLYFVDPMIYFMGNFTQGVTAFQQNKLQTQQDTMRDFTVLQGNNLPGSTVANRIIYGIDGATGKLISASTGGTGPTIVNTSRSISSVADGQTVINAWAGLSQFWIGANAELFGDQGLYPGKIVYLTGSALPGGNIGYWVVARAKHIMSMSGTPLPTNDKYTTQVEVLRNTSGTTPKFTGVVTVSPEIVTCTNSGGKWQASNQSVIVDGVANGA
jgi:hypothetical protein